VESLAAVKDSAVVRTLELLIVVGRACFFSWPVVIMYVKECPGLMVYNNKGERVVCACVHKRKEESESESVEYIPRHSCSLFLVFPLLHAQFLQERVSNPKPGILAGDPKPRNVHWNCPTHPFNSMRLEGWVCSTPPSGRSHAHFAEREQEFGKSQAIQSSACETTNQDRLGI